MASDCERLPALGGGQCDDLTDSKSKRRINVKDGEANEKRPNQNASKLSKQVKRAKEATRGAVGSSRKVGSKVERRLQKGATSNHLIQFESNKLPARAKGLLQVIVILVPILINSSAICLSYRLPAGNGPQLSASALDHSYSMELAELDSSTTQPVEAMGFAAREIGFGGPTNQLDGELIGAEPLQTLAGQPFDWAQRVRASPSSLLPTQQHDQFDAQWPPPSGDGRVLGLTQLISKNETQQSPLSRVIEATKTFVKHQHQQLAANTAAALSSTYQQQQPVVMAPTATDSGPRMVANEAQLQMNSMSPSNGSQVATRLYNFLFQPKGQLLSSAISQSLAEVKRKMSQQQLYDAAGPMTRPDQVPTMSASQEPFQLASSEGNFQHWSARSARDQRSLVTLSAPYEQQQAASGNSNSLPLSSGRYQEASTSELHGTRDQWQQMGGNEQVGVSDEVDEQSNLELTRNQQQIEQQHLGEAEPSGELPDREAVRDESSDQRHLTSPEQNNSQSNVNAFANQPDDQVEIQRQQHHQQGQHSESLEQPGDYQEQQQRQQQVVMVNGVEALEQQQLSPEQNNRLLLQRPSDSTKTTAYLIPAGQQFETTAIATNETTSTDEQQQQPEDDVDLEQGANLQGDESLVAVQLPSQYESAIGIPPEGHYDDYFKPLGASTLHEQAATTSSFTTRDQVTSTAQNETFSVVNSTTGSQQQLQPDFAYQYYLNQQHGGNSTVQQAGGNDAHLDGQKMVVLRPVDSSNGSYYQTLNGGGGHFAANVSQQSRENKSTGEQYQIVMSHTGDQSANASANVNEDGVQLIVANSQDHLQDPNSNEKLITYTSENGQDSFARFVGKPARQTFFNKDLNESPTTPTSPAAFGAARSPSGQMVTARQPVGSRRTTRSPPLVSSTSSLGSKTATATPARIANTTDVGEYTELDSYQLLGLEPGREVAEQPQQRSQFGRYATHTSLLNRDDRLQSLANGSHGTSKKIRRLTDQREQVATPRKRHHFDGSFSRQQQTVRRPQVTEAKFHLEDLPLNAPTSSPSLDATSAAKSLVELPNKAKRLRDHHADKNELMSELLAALDRVKAAIYKLQPLTAKMNAIYRKSVTSNTRDQILDNNKGTYAKRYPPGDYDDSYDRIHPSELIERQRGPNSRSASGSNATSATSRAIKTAAMDRRADGRDQFRTIVVEGDGSSNLDSDQSVAEQFQANDSKTNAVYLPAPRKMLDEMLHRRANRTRERSPRLSSELAAAFESTKNVGARTSFIKRQGETMFDDDGDQEPSSSASRLTRRGGELPTGEEPNSMDERSPLFGYRITIYQSPSYGDGTDSPNGQEMAPDDSKEREILTYSLIDDGNGQPIEFSDVNKNGSESINWPTSNSPPSDSDSNSDSETKSGGGGESQLDSMATSESSLVPHVDDQGQDEDEQEDGEDSKRLLGSESVRELSEMNKKKKNRKKEGEKKEEAEGQKKKKKAKGQKEGEKHSKQQHKGRKGHEEHKKKKEFKKIKHHKGLMSKESHKLHRDKHIKAHDRGAAKEKALKERTQIEFFEREQIVDDEFEKGKKSTMKAGWATGHDSKKSIGEIGGKPEHGDAMSVGGSDQLGHLVEPTSNLQPAAAASSLAPMMMDSAASDEHHHHHIGGKGKSHSMVSSSGKQSNKFEKKQMEAKGKKFKGWREKGYKIITETEFIDRGSLHDSAYKKRDKGAAHHQKFKKHESKSEGHQGSMHEMHKKSHKKEEKQHKSEERKKEVSGKEEAAGKEAKKSAKKTGKESKQMEKHKKSSKHSDHDQEESALSLLAAKSVQLVGERPVLNQTNALNRIAQHDRVTRAFEPIQTAEVFVKPDDQIGQIKSIGLTTNKTVAQNEFNATGHRPIRLVDGRQQDPANNSRLKAVKQFDHFGSRPTQTNSNSSSNQSNAAPSKPQVANARDGIKIGPVKSSLANATLIDIINRLNVGRSEARAVSEFGQSNATANERRHEQMSPLIRLVNSLARLNRTQSQIETLTPTPEARSQQQNQIAMNQVQFDGRNLGQLLGKSQQSQRFQKTGQKMSESGDNLQEFGGENRRLLGMPSDVLIDPAVEHPHYISSPAILSDGRWSLEPRGTLAGVRQQPQQYFLQDNTVPFEQLQRQDGQQKQRLLFNGQPESPINFLGPNFINDYEQQPPLTNVLGADYNQQQVTGSLLVPPQTLAQMQQRLQQFSFLND